jgi:predicted esterase
VAGFPFVLVTPESTKLLPFSSPGGLEWELFASRKGDANREAALFESILGCLAAQKTIDPARIYSVGFSAGAIMTNQLHARYPGLLAASVAFSGAWFDDPAEVQGVNTLGVSVSFDWEPLDPSTVPGVLLTHGGATDQFGLGAGQTIIDFEKSAAAAVPFLTAAGRTVVECKHNGGHQPPSNLSMKTVVSYLAAHRAGEPSPYASGDLGAGWPSSCQVVR